MRRPTLTEVIGLAEAARRSPHARRVLHDALLERYGEVYEDKLTLAQVSADFNRKPYVVLLPLRVDDLTPSGDIFIVESAMSVRRRRRSWRQRFGVSTDDVAVVVVRPRDPAHAWTPWP